MSYRHRVRPQLRARPIFMRSELRRERGFIVTDRKRAKSPIGAACSLSMALLTELGALCRLDAINMPPRWGPDGAGLASRASLIRWPGSGRGEGCDWPTTSTRAKRTCGETVP